MERNTEFGVRLRQTRDAAGRSQTKQAALLGISLRALQKYEAGWVPGPERMAYIARRLGVSLTWLVGGKVAATVTVILALSV